MFDLGPLYAGRPHAYWIELHSRALVLNVDSILQELVVATAKLSYVERLMEQMTAFFAAANKLK